MALAPLAHDIQYSKQEWYTSSVVPSVTQTIVGYCWTSYRGRGSLASVVETLVHEGGSNRAADLKRSPYQFLPPSLGAKKFTLLQAVFPMQEVRARNHFWNSASWRSCGVALVRASFLEKEDT